MVFLIDRKMLLLLGLNVETNDKNGVSHMFFLACKTKHGLTWLF